MEDRERRDVSGEKRCSHGGRGGKGGRVFQNRAAPAFCWLNGKTEERKREKNERRGKERASEQVTSPFC